MNSNIKQIKPTTYFIISMCIATKEHLYEEESGFDIFTFLLRYSFLLNDATKPQNSRVQKTSQLNAPQGNIYMGARYLDPKYSRWISTDPALAEYIPGAGKANARDAGGLPGMGGVFNSVNLSLYHYAGNNPLRYVDPDGRKSWENQLLRHWLEDSYNDCPPTQQEMFDDFINVANQQFCVSFEKIQSDISNGIVSGMRFMADHGSELSLICYTTGHVELGLVIDGISFACDVTVAISDYQDSERTFSDKIILGTDLATTFWGTFRAGNLSKQVTKGINKLGREEFFEKCENMLSNLMGTEFNSRVDTFVEECNK